MSEDSKKRRLNRYTCSCGNSILSEDIDPEGGGVTPFQIPCGACGGSAFSSFYRTTPEDQALPADIEWFKPSPAQARKLSQPMHDHVILGGLVMRVVSNRPAVHHLRVLTKRQWR